MTAIAIPMAHRRRVRGRWTTLVALVMVPLVFGVGATWAYWMANSTAGSNGQSAATSVNAGNTPTVNAVGTTVSVSWAASTLATGQAVAGYQVKRYDASTLVVQAILSACTGTIAATTCMESSVPAGSWKYSVTPVFATNWLGAESAKSATVTVDSVAPTNSLSLSGIVGGAWMTGTTVYYAGAAAGSFTLTNAVADAGSGPASSQTAALTGTTTGWTHTPSTVSTPAGGPYVSSPFSWAAATTSGPGEVVTGRDVAGNSVTTSLTLVNDSTAPSAGSISYPDGYQPGRSVTVTFTSGTDGGSGINTRQLQRASAILTAGTCGSFGAFGNIGPNNPTSVYTDSQVTNGVCYKYQFVVTDFVGNQHTATSANVAKVDYAGAVNTTALSHWRFGDAALTAVSSDTFTGSNATALTSHTGEVGATWTKQVFISATEWINTNRIHREGLGYSINYASGTPPSADYSVEADLVVRSNLGGDMAGVLGRMNTGTNTFYMARWEQADTSWNLIKYSNGTVTYLDFAAGEPALTVGATYRISLSMNGNILNVYVNGVLKASALDSSLTAAGKAGIMDGDNAAFNLAYKSSTTGLHFDNFLVSPYPVALDSKSTNHGRHVNGVTLGIAGALPGDTNTAAQFDGVNDYVQMLGTTGIPVGASVRSVELWFKTSSATRQVLFAYGTVANTQEFGLWLDSSGTTMTAWGFGSGNDKVFTMPAAVNNGVWHQVVQTYDGTSLTVYIDGVALPAQAATRGTVMDSYGFNVGAITHPDDGNSGGYFVGSIDEVSFYTTAVNQTTVTNHYQLGTSPAADVTGPTGGSVDAAGLVGTGSRYSTSTTLSLVLNKGTDASGIASTGALLNRATATLTSGTCGTFGSYTLISGGTDPISPKSNSVADQACYRYQYVVADTMGNNTTYTSGDIKVDTTAPTTPTLAFSSFTNTYWGGSGTTVYYRSTASAGSVTVTGTATDAASGVAGYSYPALGTNWTSTPGALGVNTYSWSGAPAAPGTKNVTATNNATAVSANSPFTMTADDTAPTGSTVSYVDGSTGGTTVSVTFTTGTDAGSGIGTRLLQRASAPITGITCGAYGSFATVVGGTNPTSPLVDTVTTDNCYMYQYVVADAVGNVQTATSASVAHTPFGAHYAFDAGSGTSAVDSTGNGNIGTLQTGATWTTGKVGTNAVNLNGTTGYVSVPNPVIDTSQSYTVTAWVKLAATSGFQTFASLDGVNISPFYLQLDGGVFRFTHRLSDSTSAGVTSVAGLSPTVGTWYHLAGVYNKTAGTIEFYVNGVLQGSAAYSSAWKANGATNIGRARFGGGPVDYVNGAIDEVHFYDRALTSAEIAAGVGFSNMVTTTPGLLSYWRLGEASAVSPMDDITATNNDGAYVNVPTVGVAGALNGDSNTAVQFDGVGDYATAARQISTSFSIEFWFKSTQSYSNDLGNPHCTYWWQGASLVDADSAGPANDFGISLCSGQLIAGVGPPDTSIVTPGTYNDGAWHHVVFTRTQATGAMILYVDGASAGTATGNVNALTATPTMNIGRSTAGVNYFAGTIDELAVYNTALSAATVAAHRNAR